MSSVTEVQSFLEALPATDRREAIIRVAQNLPQSDQAAVSRALADPSPSMTDRLWLVIVGVFAAIAVGMAIAITAAVFWAVQYDVLVTVFTTVTAFLAGLAAPSPIANRPDNG